jgi:ribonuclease Z
MDFSITFTGTAGSVPTARRGLPSYLIRHGGLRVLVDCGEGTQRQLLKSTGLVDLDSIFITHFHADHWLGLPGLLKTFDLRERDRPLTVHGPEGIERVMAFAREAAGATRYPVEVHTLSNGDVVDLGGLNVAPFPVQHRGAAVGYALYEEDRPGRVDVDRARELGIEPGPDLGRIQAGETVRGIGPSDLLGPARPGRKLVLSGDTAPNESLLLAAHGADVLVHESTFLHEEAERAAEKAHSTATQAAECASSAGVKLLALTHLSSRYLGREIEEEARQTFAESHVPRDFDSVEIPFEESGSPRLVRPERKSRKGAETRTDVTAA